MPTSVATHASLLLKAAPAHFHPKPFFSPRAAASAARIPPPPAVPGCRHRLPTATTTVAVGRWFRFTPARGLCAAAPHSGREGMGSDGAEVTRRRVTPPVNGVAKDVPAVNGLSKEDRPSPAPPRLLTLPTVLTIGRVAAVPLLISSKRDCLLFPCLFFLFFDLFRVFSSMIMVCCGGYMFWKVVIRWGLFVRI
jgi:CDP-diacylglycerol---glycerol-3-phosphate 3-phosphatidyltransferase